MGDRVIADEQVEVAPGVRLYVERRPGEPSGSSFVLVHGLASNLRLWDGVAEDLHARGHMVVALDQRGHGRSDAPEGGYDLGTAVADLAALVAALGLDRPILVGQSWGATSCWSWRGGSPRRPAASRASTAGSSSWPNGSR